jgi:hypothetical protein
MDAKNAVEELIRRGRYDEAERLLITSNLPDSLPLMTRIQQLKARKRAKARSLPVLVLLLLLVVICAAAIWAVAEFRNNPQPPGEATMIQSVTVVAALNPSRTSQAKLLVTSKSPTATLTSTPSRTLSPAEQAVALEQALRTVPGIKNVLGVRVVDEASGGPAFQIQVEAAPASDLIATVEAVRLAVAHAVEVDHFNLMVSLSLDAGSVDLAWDDKTQIWSAVGTPQAAIPLAQSTEITPRVYYVVGLTYLRACPHKICEKYAALDRSTAVIVTGSTQGDSALGNDLWYRVRYANRTGFIPANALSAQN